MDEDKMGEFVEVLSPFGEVARKTWLPNGTPWSALELHTRYAWSKVADAVLDEYDPEWSWRR